MNQITKGLKEWEAPAFFYGWIIVFSSFLTLGVVFGVWYSYSVFILVVIKEFGWSTASASSIFSIFIMSQALAGMAAGYLQDRFGPRIVIPAGAMILSLALILTSRAQNLWQFQIFYGFLAGSGISLLGFASHSAFIPKWFERKRGLALGIAMSGIGFGMLLLVPLTEKLITLYGWRDAYIYLACISLFVIAPVNLVFTRRNPAAVNQHPDGDPPDNQQKGIEQKRSMIIIDKKWAAQDWDLRKAVYTKRFWCLTSAFFTISFAFQGTLLHAVSSMVDAGMNRDTAAYFFGIAGIAGSGGKILFGYLSDVLGRERSKSISDVVALVGILALMAAALIQGPTALLFAVFFGLGYGAAAPLIPAITADIFLGRHFGLIFAMIGIGGGIGGALGTYITGLLRDITGSYTVPFAVCCLSLVISSVLVWLSSPGKVRKMVSNSE